MAKRILVVDDDPSLLRMVHHILADGGFLVIGVAGASDALARLESGGIDLVITDIIMPEMEGIEFIQAIKAKLPRLPVIAMSGGGRSHNTGLLHFAHELGADAILAKPFRRQELLSLVTGVLRSP